MTFTLPNGKPLDKEMVEMAMEDSDLSHSYFLDTQTGEVIALSDYDDFTEEREHLLEEIDGSDQYLPIERISTHEAYQWMEAFVAEIVEPKNARVAEKLYRALRGKGAFRRFKDALNSAGEQWVQTWYHWREVRFDKAIKEWFTDESLETIEKEQ